MREREQQQQLQQPTGLPDAEDSDAGADGFAVVGEDAGETIILRGLVFTGKAELLPEGEKARVAAAVEGERVGIAGLYALAAEVTRTLQASGYLLARAILPPQDITEGVVTVEIVEGTLEDIAFERGEMVRANEDRLQVIAQSHIAADSVRRDDLEAALLRLNDHPSVAAKARLTPGAAAGTSRLIVDVEQAPIFSASLSGDNFGSPSTGRAQANAALVFTDVTGYGDLTQVYASASEGQRFGQAAFSMPLGASGVTASADYGYLDYHNIDETGSALGLEGYAHFAGAGLDWSVLRSRDFNLRFNAGADWKALVDDSLVGRLQDKRVLSGTLGASFDARDDLLGGGLTYGSLAWTFGDLDLSREASALAADAAGLQTQGQFHLVNASLARVQDLPGDFSLFARTTGQWANKNLDSSEDFSLGGPNGVRGFGTGSGQGDMGVLGTIELRYDAPVPQEFGTLQLAGFLDAGHVWVNRNENGIPAGNACGCNEYGLASIGVSARWVRENLSVSASYAHGLGDDPGRAIGEASDNQQFWLSGAIRF